jgi:ADP-ribose pyrophosphatase YjhB (NUDIX family)
MKETSYNESSIIKLMEIRSTLTAQSGQTIDIVYNDIPSELDLGDKKIQGVHAYCFCGDKLVVVYSERKGYWTPPGGSVEEGEDARAAVQREVKEETNMKVLKQRVIGCQDITGPKGVVSQIRSVCIVEPNGPFAGDPDGEVTKIELIDPKDYKKYFDWGEIGDHIMRRALELKAQMDLEATTALSP